MASDVERIKERLPIEEVIGAYVRLERSSGHLKGCCPFHSEKTPSFFVSPERNSYYCFGCGAKGDIFTFVQEFEHIDFRAALTMLAERAGITLTKQATTARADTADLYEVIDKAALYYQKQLAERKDVIQYLTNRGMTIATIKAWRIGFAPDEWKSASTALIGKGYSKKQLEETGLIKRSERDQNDYYDRFRSRIMFPLFDSTGRVIGFSGRIFGNDTDAAKYLNSPETVLFDKSSFLYGLDRAKLAIRSKGEVVVVEGQMDLIMSHQAGITHTVAVSGTAFTEKHVDLLKRFATKLLLAFDADSAGERANERAMTMALARGVDVNIISIEGGKDPADVVKDDPALWQKAVASSQHIILYELERAMRLGDERARNARIESHVLPAIAALRSSLDQGHFLSKVSLRSGISEQRLQEALKKISVSDSISHEQAPSIKQQRTIERRLAALVVWLKAQQGSQTARPDLTPESVSDDILKKTDQSTLDYIAGMITQSQDELAFEGDVLYRNSKSLRKEYDEIIGVLQEEFLKKSLAAAMTALKNAEQQKDNTKISEWLRRCQELSQQLHKLKNRL